VSDAENTEDLGRMSPVQVVQCAEGSNTYCWIRAEATGVDGTRITYECCGGAGQKASFTARTGFLSSKSVDPQDIPDGLSWSRRYV
jgi:hypothetical protein